MDLAGFGMHHNDHADGITAPGGRSRSCCPRRVEAVQIPVDAVRPDRLIPTHPRRALRARRPRTRAASQTARVHCALVVLLVCAVGARPNAGARLVHSMGHVCVPPRWNVPWTPDRVCSYAIARPSDLPPPQSPARRRCPAAYPVMADTLSYRSRRRGTCQTCPSLNKPSAF
jgi:hypothetical protein